LKAIDELVFRQTCRDLGIRGLIARVFAVGGGANPNPGRYALDSFVSQALAGGPVVVRADHPVRRSYVGVEDLVVLALSHLLSGGPADDGGTVVFETGGEVVEMGELAARVVEAVGAGTVVRERFDPQAPADDYLGDPAVMLTMMAAYGLRPAGIDQLIREAAGTAPPDPRR
jgi:nucleoside-diphosphate-sugar epimerase